MEVVVEENHENNLNLASEKIALGFKLIEQLNIYKNINGAQKIQRKIKQEITFLQKAISSKTLKLNHIVCSNLIHYDFLIKVLSKQFEVVYLDCSFPLEELQKSIKVDIVCDSGAKWIKVIARNSKSILAAAEGRTSYGVKSVVDQAEEYVMTSEQNLHLFKPPKIQFYFSNEDIDLTLLNSIREIGVETKTLNDTIETNQENEDSLNILNLDITTMLAYVSALSNGSHRWIFQELLLTEQAERENKTPVKPFLDNLFQGKQLICCRTAYNAFDNIVQTLAGPLEKERAKEFIKKIEIHEDLSQIPSELEVLTISGKIKPRSLKTFLFGLEMKAITVTSNESFLRSAKMQGINIPAITHQARALTEIKEINATPIGC